jgi:hypothetical protein
VPLGAARSRANVQLPDLAAPRVIFERLSAWGKRAAWAHQSPRKGTRKAACHRFITSARTSPEALLRLIQQRWSNENEWHGPVTCSSVRTLTAMPTAMAQQLLTQPGSRSSSREAVAPSKSKHSIGSVSSPVRAPTERMLGSACSCATVKQG